MAELRGSIRAPEHVAAVHFLSCDHNDDGEFEAWAGWRQVHPVILATQPPPAILMMGLRSEGAVRKHFSNDPTIVEMLDWPGFRYLRYGFDREGLLAAAEAALAGRGAPVPLPSAINLRDAAQPVAHWLQGVGGVLHDAQADFATAARGGAALHPTYLHPSDHFGDGPHAMLRRLRIVLRACAFLDDRVNLEEELARFAASFAAGLQRLEGIKARLAAAPNRQPVDIFALAEAAAASLLDFAQLRDHVVFIERQTDRREAGGA